MRSAIAMALAAGVVLPSSARADDSKKDTLTVEPWTEATVAFTGEEKRASLTYAQFLPRDLAIHVQASAPLDEDTKVAAFTSDNDFAGGFKAALQFGYDGRAAYWRGVAEDLHTIVAMRKKIIISPLAAQKVSYCTHKGITSCTDANVLAGICPDPSTCVLKTEAAATQTPACSARIPELAAPPPAPGAPPVAGAPPASWSQATDEACFRQAWAKDVVTRADLYRKGLTAADRIYPDRATLRDVAVRIRPKEFIDKLKAQGVPVEDAIFYSDDTFADALDKLLEGGPLAVRDAFVTGVFTTPKQTYAALLDVSLSLDRLKVFQDDVGPKATDETVADFEIGANVTWYTEVTGLSVNVRGGYEYSKESKAKAFKRCKTLTSSDGMVTGQQCDEKALFRSGARPEPTHSPYARLAVDYQYLGTPKNTKVIPGAELRLGAETLTEDPELEARLTLYATPVTGSTAARMGIAGEMIYDHTPDTMNDEPKKEFIVFVFIGLTTSDLMKL